MDFVIASAISNWDKIDVIVSIVSTSLLLGVVVLTVVTARAGITSANAASKSADAAEAANKKASDESKIRLRAYVNIGMPTEYQVQSASGVTLAIYDVDKGIWMGDVLDSNFVTENPNSDVIFRIPIINSGITAADRLAIVRGTSELGEKTLRLLYENAATGGSMLSPGLEIQNQLLLPLTTFDRYKRDLVKPEFLGLAVIYSDSFRDTWITAAVFKLSGRNIELVQASPPTPFDEANPKIAPPWRPFS